MQELQRGICVNRKVLRKKETIFVRRKSNYRIFASLKKVCTYDFYLHI